MERPGYTRQPGDVDYVASGAGPVTKDTDHLAEARNWVAPDFKSSGLLPNPGLAQAHALIALVDRLDDFCEEARALRVLTTKIDTNIQRIHSKYVWNIQ